MTIKKNNIVDLLKIILKVDAETALIDVDLELNTHLINKEFANEIKEDIDNIGQKIYDYWSKEIK